MMIPATVSQPRVRLTSWETFSIHIGSTRRTSVGGIVLQAASCTRLGSMTTQQLIEYRKLRRGKEPLRSRRRLDDVFVFNM